MVVVALLVFTEPGQRIWTSAVDWATERAAEWTTDRIEEQQERPKLRERERGIDPMCGDVMKPKGFEVSGGEAIALVVGKRKIDSDQVDLESMDGGITYAPVWAVHIDSKRPGGCGFGAEVDGETGEVSNRHRSCAEP